VTRRERILLVGMMGAGKTTVGRALATRLGYGYVDSDYQVESRTGQTVREIFETRGEAAFREDEKLALREALAADGPMVVSVAGGAVLDPDNREQLRHAGLVVWLKASPEVLARRVVSQGPRTGHRPLLGDDPLSALTHLYRARAPLYEELADLVIDVEERTPEEAVQEVLDHLEEA
jgi:shikimate kinase